MRAPEPLPAMAQPQPASGAGVVSQGWLGSQSIFDQRDDRKLGRAFTTSFVLHGLMFLAIAWGMWRTAEIAQQNPEKYDLVFMEAPGPGGGGGGSPAPAPPKKLEIAKAAPAPTPVVPTPVPVAPPPPELNAPVQTNIQQLMQATGASSVSMQAYAGGGSGGGIGPGRGTGVGPGTGGGFGGGAFQPGSGIKNPELIKKVEPKYTSEAMRAKVQGEVELEAVVLPNGTIGDIRVVKSLDRTFGLDEKAIEAARGWVFVPGTRIDPVTKVPTAVPVVVRLILEFRLH